jgi:hypothetical protein
VPRKHSSVPALREPNAHRAAALRVLRLPLRDRGRRGSQRASAVATTRLGRVKGANSPARAALPIFRLPGEHVHCHEPSQDDQANHDPAHRPVWDGKGGSPQHDRCRSDQPALTVWHGRVVERCPEGAQVVAQALTQCVHAAIVGGIDLAAEGRSWVPAHRWGVERPHLHRLREKRVHAVRKLLGRR